MISILEGVKAVFIKLIA